MEEITEEILLNKMKLLNKEIRTQNERQIKELNRCTDALVNDIGGRIDRLESTIMKLFSQALSLPDRPNDSSPSDPFHFTGSEQNSLVNRNVMEIVGVPLRTTNTETEIHALQLYLEENNGVHSFDGVKNLFKAEEDVKQEVKEEDDLERIVEENHNLIEATKHDVIGSTQSPKEQQAFKDEGDNEKAGFNSCEKAELKEMQKLKKQKICEMLDSQNASIDANTNNRRRGRLKYIMQQTELFAHFTKSDSSSSKKKQKRRDSHASKIIEEEQDEEYLNEEEGGLIRPGSSKLLTQLSSVQGKLRYYQLAGLNRIILIYVNDINGILEDERDLIHICDVTKKHRTGIGVMTLINPRDIKIEIFEKIISVPYVEMMLTLIESFGVKADYSVHWDCIFVKGGQKYMSSVNAYVKGELPRASYFLAGADITGGTFTIRRWGTSSLQGNMKFVKLLKKTGCTVIWTMKYVILIGQYRDNFGIGHIWEVDIDVLSAVGAAGSKTQLTKFEHDLLFEKFSSLVKEDAKTGDVITTTALTSFMDYFMDMYIAICREVLNAKEKSSELNKWKMEKAQRSQEARSVEELALVVIFEPAEVCAGSNGMSYKHCKDSPLYFEWDPGDVKSVEVLEKISIFVPYGNDFGMRFAMTLSFNILFDNSPPFLKIETDNGLPLAVILPGTTTTIEVCLIQVCIIENEFEEYTTRDVMKSKSLLIGYEDETKNLMLFKVNAEKRDYLLEIDKMIHERCSIQLTLQFLYSHSTFSLIYGNHGEEVKQFLHNSLHSTYAEVIQYGAPSGFDLSIIGMVEEVYNDVKSLIYIGSMVVREAASTIKYLLLVVIAASYLEEFSQEVPKVYKTTWDILKSADCILVPGGFDHREVQAQILASKYASAYQKELCLVFGESRIGIG